MYDQSTKKVLEEKARTLLQNKSNNASPESQIDDLKEVINYNDWRYYVQDDPSLADQEYDTLFSRLKDLEKQHPEFITKDSPTQRVAKGLTKDFPTVSHIVPMLSLDNSYNAENLREWDKRVHNIIGEQEVTYCVEPKFDGAGISLIYEDNLLTRGATRGNGVQGDDITTNAKQIRSIPLSAALSTLDINQMEIRGEVLINKNVFEKFNAERAKESLSPLANPRNAASGSLRMVDPQEVKKRKLEVFLYHVSYLELKDADNKPKSLQSHYGTLNALSKLGFRTPIDTLELFTNIDDVIQHCIAFEAKRDELPYEIDGLVIKVNSFELQEELGMTAHHPRWAMAYKFKARQASSKVLKVEFQVGRTGTITPVAKIEPVPIGGAIVSSVSLFNEDVVREKDVKIGDTVIVERAGDVIPYIVKPLTDLRNGNEKKIQFPTNCPVCGDKLEKAEAESAWRCININCEAQVVERLIHFGSKNAMDIRNLGEANVRKFYELGFLKDLPGIYNLNYLKIVQLEGYGKKSIENLQKAIEASKQQPLHRLIYALGIRFVGENTAKTLAQVINNLFDLKDINEEQLLSLEDIGPKVAHAILRFFDNDDNIQILKKLEAAGVSMEKDKEELTSGALEGLTFLFTGSLSMKRSEAKALAESKGGKVLSGVSSKLNYLVAGEKAGSKLSKAKKLNTVKILSEEEFLLLLDNSSSSFS